MRVLAAAAFALVLAGCDGLAGGEEAARIPLQPAAEGGYAPVRILLRPDMNPVAFNLHADFAWGRHEEAGRWNSYRVTLRGDTGEIATRSFQVNSPERPQASSSAPPSALAQPLLLVDVPAEGEYEVVIAALQPAAVTLEAPQLAVRIHVPRTSRP
jgi:hypothetical protein